jgi:hypothetical protein
MRTIAIISSTLAALFLAGLGARAEYAGRTWCAYYGRSGATNCGFYSYEQCMAAISGNSGFCSRNQWYGSAGNSRGRQRD